MAALSLTFTALLDVRPRHERVLDGVQQLAVGLEGGEAALEACLGFEGAR